MKCPKCGENISSSAKFCTKCGANVPEALEKQARIKAEEEKKRLEAEEEARRKAEEEAKKKAEESEKLQEIEKKNENVKFEETVENIEEPVVTEKTKKEKKSPKDEKREEKQKEKKPKKKHKGLKFLLVLILILIILCAGSYGLYKLDVLPDSVNDVLSPIFETVEGWFGIEKEDSNDNNKDEMEEDKKVKDEKVIKKVDEDKDLVYDYYNKEILGNTYKVPAINLDYDNIEDINDKIADLVEADLKKYEKLKELPEMEPTGMDYVWYENDNILSVVFFIEGYHVDYYYVYNVDIYTGENIENKDILDAAKIDEYDFAEICSDAVEDYYDNYLYDIKDMSLVGEVFEESKLESIKESNFSVSKTDMYLNKYGELTIVAKVTTIAGAGINNVIVDVENYKRNSKPVFESANSTSNVNVVLDDTDDVSEEVEDIEDSEDNEHTASL